MKIAVCLGLLGGGFGAASYRGRECPDNTLVAPVAPPDGYRDDNDVPPRRGRLRRLLPPVVPRDIYVPYDDRVENYGPSCAWAVIATMLNYHGQEEMAKWIVQNQYGGVTIEGVVETLRRNGYQARYLTSIEEVEQSIRDAKPVGYCCQMFGGGYHARMLIHLDEYTAKYIDPNDVNRVVETTRQEWIEQWYSCAQSGMVIDMPIIRRDT